jgi:Oxidoreductase family, C-terminal alpha/beta domain
VLVRFEGGARGALVVSQVSPGHKNDLALVISGAAASLSWQQEDPERLRLADRSQVIELHRDPVRQGAATGPHLPAGHPEGWAEALRDLLIPFYAAIASGMQPADFGAQAPYPTPADGARSIAITAAVLESASRGGWASVKSVPAPQMGGRAAG